jgi:hypothetical protein
VKGFYKCLADDRNRMTVSISFSGRRILGKSAINQGYEFILTNVQNPPSMAPSSAF